MVKAGIVTTAKIEDIAMDKAERLYPNNERLALKEYYRTLEKYSKVDNKQDKQLLINKVQQELLKKLFEMDKEGNFIGDLIDEEWEILEGIVTLRDAKRVNLLNLKKDNTIKIIENERKEKEIRQQVKKVTTVVTNVKDLLGI